MIPDRHHPKLLCLVLTSLGMVVTGCDSGSKSPLGRQRTLLFGDRQVNRLAEGVFRDLKAENVEVDPNSDTVRRVRRVADALIAGIERPFVSAQVMREILVNP